MITLRHLLMLKLKGIPQSEARKLFVELVFEAGPSPLQDTSQICFVAVFLCFLQSISLNRSICCRPSRRDPLFRSTCPRSTTTSCRSMEAITRMILWGKQGRTSLRESSVQAAWSVAIPAVELPVGTNYFHFRVNGARGRGLPFDPPRKVEAVRCKNT